MKHEWIADDGHRWAADPLVGCTFNGEPINPEACDSWPEEMLRLAARVRELEGVNGGWQCFHCGVIFRGDEAAEHFGRREDADPPMCLSTQHPLVVRLRARIAALEAENAALRAVGKDLLAELGPLGGMIDPVRRLRALLKEE